MNFQSQRVAGFATSVFSEFSRRSVEHGSVNLGQGFPDFDGPEEVKRAAFAAIEQGLNQYSVGQGAAPLRMAIAAHAKRFYGQQVDPVHEVAVTCGATEAIFDAVLALCDPGDEVVLFEPFYDSYLASVQLANAVPRFVCLRAPDQSHPLWCFDDAELEAAFTDRTRLVIVNTPHNPTGKVFTRGELERIGQLAAKHGAVVLSDEVYEHLVFSPARHLRPATIPSLADRTLTVSSAGKSFSFTGWKVGWAIGPQSLVSAVQKAHQWVTFAAATPLQHAIATALALPDQYFSDFLASYAQKRGVLAAALTGAGFEVLPTEGSYFIIADSTRLIREGEDDTAFCTRLLTEAKVTAIPPSVFYSPEHADRARSLARFAFCKTEATLAEAVKRLAAYRF